MQVQKWLEDINMMDLKSIFGVQVLFYMPCFVDICLLKKWKMMIAMKFYLKILWNVMLNILRSLYLLMQKVY